MKQSVRHTSGHGHTFGNLLSIQCIRELRVLIVRNLIFFMIISGSFGTNITLPSPTTLPAATNQLDKAEPQPTETQEIIEIITEIIYTELPEVVFEVFNEPALTTSQLRDINVVSKTQISGLNSALITNGVTTTPTKATVSTVSTTTETPTSQRPSPTPTVFHNRNSNYVTTQAENSIGTTLFSDVTTTKAAISTTISTSISPDGSTTQTIASTEQTSPIISTLISTEDISTESTVTPQNTKSISSEPSINSTTALPIPELETNISTTQRTSIQTTQQREHLSSSASPQISTTIYSTNIYFPNSTTEKTSITNSTTDHESTNHSATVRTIPANPITDRRTITTIPIIDDIVTTIIYDDENSTIRYVDGDPTGESSRDDLPILLIVIASTVAVLVTLFLLCFVLIMCAAKKHQQRKNAKYYDYKKRWVKKAPERPKYEKVNQHLTYDQEAAAGSGWVFRDGNDPSKQITLELRPRHANSPPGSPLDFPDTDSSKARNLEGALPENFPPDLLSVSQEGGLDLDLNFGSLGSLRGLSKGLALSNHSMRSSSSEGDSGILALGEEAWSPTKGVPFHFISDDAVIEL